MRQHSLRRSAALAATAVVSSLVLVACQGAESDDDGAPAEDEGTGEAVTLDVVGWVGGGTQVADVPEINARFEAENPDIDLNFTVVARDEYDQYNNTRFASGDAADVVQVDPGLMRAWQSSGFLADLSDESWTSAMRADLAPFSQVDGNTYQFVQEVIPIGMYTNLDLLASVGIDHAPTTWDELLADLDALEAAGKNGLLLSNKGGWSGIQMAFLSAANTVYAEDPAWNDTFNAGDADFTPDWSPVVDQIRTLITDGHVDPQLMLGIDPWSDALNQFKAGEWAFTLQGAWELTDFKANATFPFEFSPFPGGEDARGFKFVGTGLAINAESDQQEAARRYLEFWADPENVGQYDAAENAFSPLDGVSSELAEEAAPYLAADADGRVIISPEQFWARPAAGNDVGDAVQALFLDPAASNESILAMLDEAIGGARTAG